MMSWDLIIQSYPDDALRVLDIPEEFQPIPLGTRSEIIKKIQEVAPEVNFSGPSWGLMDGGDWSIEFDMGNEESCTSIGMHVRGSELVVGVVARILEHCKLRAIDCQTSEFFDNSPDSLESFRRWRAFRDRCVGDYG